MWRIGKSYRFEAAHWLPKVQSGHPCARTHGHSYKVTVECVGCLTAEVLLKITTQCQQLLSLSLRC